MAPAVKRSRRRGSYGDIDLHSTKAVVWPPGPFPTLTGPEAIRAAKRLWRHAMGKAWPGTWTAGRGNHRTHPRGSVFLVNPGQGWRDIVHDLSHCAFRRLTSDNPWCVVVEGRRVEVASEARRENFDHVRTRDTAGRRVHHSDAHAEIEREMVRMVVESGWLDGSLKEPSRRSTPDKADPPATPKTSRREKNEARVDAGIARWTVKLQKARKAVETAERRLQEFQRKKRYYDRLRG